MVNSVTVQIKGEIITSGSAPGGTTAFLDLSETLWSKTMGDPRNPEGSSAQKWGEKLQGDYCWPFSIELPRDVTLVAKNRPSGDVFRLPQTFLERFSKAGIQYKLEVRFTRSRLKIDNMWVLEMDQMFSSQFLAEYKQPSTTSPYLNPRLRLCSGGWHTKSAALFSLRILIRRAGAL